MKFAESKVNGAFVEFNQERFYKISNVNQMSPFFMSVVSDSDHWLFISSNSGVTAGRVSAQTSLFPYQPVDKVQDSVEQTGNKTIIRCQQKGACTVWEPFCALPPQPDLIERNLYKNTLGNKLCFEETHHSLGLRFRFTWQVSDDYGFVIESELMNQNDRPVEVELIDGLQNILPADVPGEVQTNASNLVDAYRLAEIEPSSGVGVFSLYSGITDKPQPVEVLKANIVYAVGLDVEQHLLSSQQLSSFRQTGQVQPELQIKGIRSAYLVKTHFKLAATAHKSWQFVANVNQPQTQVESMIDWLSQDTRAIQKALYASIQTGSDRLFTLMAQADGLQQTALENEQVHHYSNVLFNTMRGGIFNDHFTIDSQDFAADVRHFNSQVYQQYAEFLNALPRKLQRSELQKLIGQQNDSNLERLFVEYLPITFGRRHGDPSRPWNKFAINIKATHGKELLSYEGNWRDIFQNWEALLLSYPEFIESVIAKFVNASTVDGFNPYRITKKGIDWEIEDPKDPWSYIGYWGDHQIIYLLKLLQISQKYHPGKLPQLLRHEIYSYANVPYRIVDFKTMLQDAKNTVHYDEDLEQKIAMRVEGLGADGKLILDTSGQVYQVNLLEKLLVPLLSKLSNFVLRGGIWLNTQRPEWNDANNALVGQGLSMVTLYYIRRYLSFMQVLLAEQTSRFECSSEVVSWFEQIQDAIARACSNVQRSTDMDEATRLAFLTEVGQAASEYRQQVYANGFSGRSYISVDLLRSFVSDALYLVDDSIRFNQRPDKLFHAYNLVRFTSQGIEVDYLYEMLEGQVAALSAGTLSSEEVLQVLDGLFHSPMYRADQKTFMLYPDDPVTSFLQKNLIQVESVEDAKRLAKLCSLDSQQLLVKSSKGEGYRFHSNLTSLDVLQSHLQSLEIALGDDYAATRTLVVNLYQKTFNHAEFTGRSHGMFGFEGLGCIYWHMVSKLLLASQESFFRAMEQGESTEVIQRLGEYYYRIREGIGFNKTPTEYGAFPYDPYSHTPKHSGAQQPGMTGQVKEEIITRFGELGIQVDKGQVHIHPSLLRRIEFAKQPSLFEYVTLENDRNTLELPPNSLAFTFCQTPFVYRLLDSANSRMTIKVYFKDGTFREYQGNVLPVEIGHSIFGRDATIQYVEVSITHEMINF